jgi:hypothetical protein
MYLSGFRSLYLFRKLPLTLTLDLGKDYVISTGVYWSKKVHGPTGGGASTDTPWKRKRDTIDGKASGVVRWPAMVL